MNYVLTDTLTATELRELRKFVFWQDGWKLVAGSLLWGAALIVGIILFFISDPFFQWGTCILASTAIVSAIYSINDGIQTLVDSFVTRKDASRARENTLKLDSNTLSLKDEASYIEVKWTNVTDLQHKQTGIFFKLRDLQLFLPNRTFESKEHLRDVFDFKVSCTTREAS